MKTIAKILGGLALSLTLIPPILNASQALAESTMKGLMLGGCVLWFITAPMFMKGGAA